jgi:hypothetical protein
VDCTCTCTVPRIGDEVAPCGSAPATTSAVPVQPIGHTTVKVSPSRRFLDVKFTCPVGWITAIHFKRYIPSVAMESHSLCFHKTREKINTNPNISPHQHFISSKISVASDQVSGSQFISTSLVFSSFHSPPDHYNTSKCSSQCMLSVESWCF